MPVPHRVQSTSRPTRSFGPAWPIWFHYLPLLKSKKSYLAYSTHMQSSPPIFPSMNGSTCIPILSSQTLPSSKAKIGYAHSRFSNVSLLHYGSQIPRWLTPRWTTQSLTVSAQAQLLFVLQWTIKLRFTEKQLICGNGY